MEEVHWHEFVDIAMSTVMNLPLTLTSSSSPSHCLEGKTLIMCYLIVSTLMDFMVGAVRGR